MHEGALETNTTRILDARGRAAALGADLVLTPELSIAGYPPEDLVMKPAFIEACREGIELLAAAQGIDFHLPLQTSKPLQDVMHILRAQVSHYSEDHYFAPDIRIATRIVEAGTFLPFLGRKTLPSFAV